MDVLSMTVEKFQFLPDLKNKHATIMKSKLLIIIPYCKQWIYEVSEKLL